LKLLRNRIHCSFSLQALCGTTINVPTLDQSRIRKLQLNEVIKPTTEKRLAGDGLPFPKQPTKRGDIVVKFDIKFPDTLAKDQKETISTTLRV
jgi:DnaJ family protein B protein 4